MCTKERKALIEKFLSKENIEKYYGVYSANYIAKKLFAPEFTTTAGTVIDRAKMFGIKILSISEAAKLQHVKNSKKDTCIKKYGYDNPSKNSIIKNRKRAKAVEKYGVENVFQSEEIKRKSRQTCLKKYGTEQVGRLGLKSSGKRSKFHKNVELILSSNKINFISEVPNKFFKFNPILNRNYSPIVDILLPCNIVIECNGDFWHANPKKYIATDIFNTWEGQKTAYEIWTRDKIRKEHIESFGYKVIVVWEYDYNHNKQLFEELLLNEITNSKNREN